MKGRCRDSVPFGDLQTSVATPHQAKKEEDEIAAELKRFSERLAVAKANLEVWLEPVTLSRHSCRIEEIKKKTI